MATYTAVNDPGSFFNPLLYTGTGSSNAVTGVGFQPDAVWIKSRSDATDNVLYDAVRGAERVVYTNTQDADAAASTGLTAFGADGFTVVSEGNVNGSSRTYVAWNWKAGTTTGIAGSPSTTPDSYSFNQTSGFSIIKYTGTGSVATIPHGLGVAPKFIITKNLDTSEDWFCYHAGIAADAETDYINLNNTTNAADNATIWNDTAPTSTLFTVGTGNAVNKSGDNIVAYCFADVSGYQRFGSFSGNGDADGAFVYTGFRPAYVMLTQSSGTGSYGWDILDDKRIGYNKDNDNLMASTSGVEDDTNDYWDLVSNGFKIRASTGNVGQAASNYIYVAFANQPFVNSKGVPCNAR